MQLTSYSVKNYQFTLVIFIMVAVVGVFTLFTMPRAEDPQIFAPQYPIVAIYPGASPQDIEELVVKPIEEKLYELENVHKIKTKINDGIAVIFIEFRYGVDVNTKYQEIVREINALREKLPKDLHSLEAQRVDPSDVNILQIGFISENASYRSLRETAKQLKEKLEKVSTLKSVRYVGSPEEIVRIDLQIDKIAQLRIPINYIIGSLQSEAVNIPAGSLNVSTKTLNVKTSGKFADLDDIRNTVVYNSNGKIIYLKDVATVSFRNEEDKHLVRINGYRAILLNAAQKPNENITKTQSLFTPIIEDFEKTLPPNIKMIKYFDQADNVSKRLGSLGTDFLIAIVLVLFTLLPLGTRASLIVMISIPLSLALGLVGLNYLGYSLNQLSIVGLVVALGLLVDDSIVVVENIERWLREGHTKKEAAIKATEQIGEAVLGCTATLIIAFAPLVFLPGGSGEFIRSLPMAVIMSVLASMFVALTVVPFLSSRMLQDKHDPEGNFFLKFLKKIISGSYTKLLDQALKRPVLALFVSFLIFIGSLGLFPVIGFRLFPASEKPIFMINLKMPLQTNLEESSRIARMVEDTLKKQSKIAYFTTNVGEGNPRVYYNEIPQRSKHDYAQIFVQLQENTSPNDKKKVIEELRQKFVLFPLAKVEIKDFEQGPPVDAPIEIRITGENLDTLRKWSFDVEKILKEHQGTIYVDNELNTLKTDLRVKINKEKARTLGIMTADIDKTVRLAIAGFEIGSYSDEGGDDYAIIINAPKDQVATLKVFDNLFVNNAIGTPIPLNQIATLTFENSSSIINHFNKNRYAKVTSFTKKGVLANNVLKEIVPKLNALKFPKGYTYSLAGEAETEKETFGDNFAAVILVTAFLFIAILILQFKTFKGTLIVLSVIPLGIVGGVGMLFLTGNPLSFVAIIGFIGLAGIEVKNSILLVDFTNQLRKEGKPLQEAIEEAGEVRFLPVVLTSLTAIGGLIPIALNNNPLISPLALVLIGGLISSTVLSRIVTPVVYKLIPPRIEEE